MKKLQETKQWLIRLIDRFVINRFVYHYCAHYQANVGVIAYIDGIVLIVKPIKTHDDYRELKKALDCPDPDKLTIDSLSLIGRKRGL